MHQIHTHFFLFLGRSQPQNETALPTNTPPTSELLSPVREGDQPPPNESNIIQKLSTLNEELTKINSRRDSVVEQKREDDDERPSKTDGTENLGPVPSAENPADLLGPKSAQNEKKERRVSRFKVSVVTEPDQSKLNVPEKRDCERTQSVAEKQPDVLNVINKTYKNLEEVVCATYSALPGRKLCFLCDIINSYM